MNAQRESGMATTASILIVGTADTKSDELLFLRQCIRDAGGDAQVMDVGVLGEALFAVDHDKHAVAAAAGTTIGAIASLGDENEAMTAMARGAAALGAAGLSSRLQVTPGDFFRDPLPTGADLVSLVRVLHDHDDEPVRGLLRRVHDAIAPGGTLLVVEPMAGVPGAEPVGEAYFALYLLAMGSGRARTPAELERLLREAGFRAIRHHAVRSPIRTGVISATA